MNAQRNVSNKAKQAEELLSISAFGSQSCEQLLNLAIDVARAHPHLVTSSKSRLEKDKKCVSFEEEKGLH